MPPNADLSPQSLCNSTAAPDRRAVLAGGAAALAACGLGAAPWQAVAADGPVTFDDLIVRARARAAQPFVPVQVPAPDMIARVDYSAHWQIRYRKDAALYPGGEDTPTQLFHPGRYFPEPVEIHFRAADGTARRIPFAKGRFEMPEDSPARGLPEGYGYAGFRVMRPDMGPDWVSFLGASYFRTDGPDRQYGLSARGIAVNTGLPSGEEFPRFTAFWLGPPERAEEHLSVWAELDGPSVSGAYRFGLARDLAGDGHRMRVEAHLFMRRDVARLGIAPLTSMYWYSERDRYLGRDWRPEIHDSDGLAMETGAGERIWRALRNPSSLGVASHFDENPRGFGLIQRDRDFANYQDDGVFYHRRPSAWVVPRGDWGQGTVQLVEIPTDDETFDNIVAYWVPEAPARAGAEFTFGYDIEWRARDPRPGVVAQVIGTRQGEAGIPGQPISDDQAKMVVDFRGLALSRLDDGARVVPVISAMGGEIMPEPGVYPVLGTNFWRLTFDFRQTGTDPVSLRAFLRDEAGRALSETWMTDATTELRR